MVLISIQYTWINKKYNTQNTIYDLLLVSTLVSSQLKRKSVLTYVYFMLYTENKKYI